MLKRPASGPPRTIEIYSESEIIEWNTHALYSIVYSIVSYNLLFAVGATDCESYASRSLKPTQEIKAAKPSIHKWPTLSMLQIRHTPL
jgi:hypothetical protein